MVTLDHVVANVLAETCVDAERAEPEPATDRHEHLCRARRSGEAVELVEREDLV